MVLKVSPDVVDMRIFCCLFVVYCSLCQTIWTRGLPTSDSFSITGLVLDKSFPQSLYCHGVILKRPRDRHHGDINPDPPATAQLQHAITWKPYGLVPSFGYITPKACLGVRRTSLTTKQNQDEIACDHKEIPYSDANLPFNARVNRNLRSSFNTKSGAEE